MERPRRASAGEDQGTSQNRNRENKSYTRDQGNVLVQCAHLFYLHERLVHFHL